MESVSLLSPPPVYMEQNYLGHDHNPEDAPIYTGDLLFNITKSITLQFIVRSLFDDPEIAINPISGFKYPDRDPDPAFYII